MIHILIIALIGSFFLSACEVLPVLPAPNSSTSITPLPVNLIPAPKPIETAIVTGNTYYVVDEKLGSDNNPGSLGKPWQTIQKATSVATAGDTIYVRGGEYDNNNHFINSGTEKQPITLSNYPGEQIVIRVNDSEAAFYCWWKPDSQNSKVDHIRILGTDVTPRTLSNGVVSQKGIVIQGEIANQANAINGWGGDYWEVAGVDFVDVAAGIRTWKENNSQNVDNSADYWNVHDNRVYGYYKESGMQFNGNYNRIENNEIFKLNDRLDSPYGCQLLNILGNNNIIHANTLSNLGSDVPCTGILFEWDLADKNVVEQNLIYDVPNGIDFEGGDNNIIRNNIIYLTEALNAGKDGSGIKIWSYDNNKTEWPCNDYDGSGSSSEALLPPENPEHPDYWYYFPHNCQSNDNQIYNNTLYGFPQGIQLSQVIGQNTIIQNNVLAGWTKSGVCYLGSGYDNCSSSPNVGLIVDHNATQGPFGFMNLQNFDFRLTADSPLIDAGYNLEGFVTSDFVGTLRPQGSGYDLGAYEYPIPKTK